MFYRVKQFLWAIKSSFTSIDKNYLEEYLDEKELEVFDGLSKADKNHCIRVSKEALSILNERAINDKFLKSKVMKQEVARAGLLHDLGKKEIPLNAFSKSVVVILHKLTKGKLKKYDNIKIIDSYYNHPEKGEKIIKEINKKYSNDFIEVIVFHHRSSEFVEGKNNLLLSIIKEADDKS